MSVFEVFIFHKVRLFLFLFYLATPQVGRGVTTLTAAVILTPLTRAFKVKWFIKECAVSQLMNTRAREQRKGT